MWTQKTSYGKYLIGICILTRHHASKPQNFDFTTKTMVENSINVSSATNDDSKMIKIEINENIDSRNNQLLSEVMRDTINKNTKGDS